MLPGQKERTLLRHIFLLLLALGLVFPLAAGCGSNRISSEEDDDSVDTCVDDSYEPNDAPVGATQVGDGTLAGLTYCPSDNDFYRISPGADEEFEVLVLFSHAEGDIDVKPSFIYP